MKMNLDKFVAAISQMCYTQGSIHLQYIHTCDAEMLVGGKAKIVQESSGESTKEDTVGEIKHKARREKYKDGEPLPLFPYQHLRC